MEKWEESRWIREIMPQTKLNMSPGCSLIEINGIVHELVKGRNIYNSR